MTFLVVVATFIGLSCLIVPLLILAAFALFDRGGDPIQSARGGGITTVTRPPG
jgi:hypothetical protein